MLTVASASAGRVSRACCLRPAVTEYGIGCVCVLTVASASLRGVSATDAAYVQQWLSFADSELVPAASNWVLPCLGAMQYNKQATERARDDVRRSLALLDATLATRTYLVGERISLADISVACSMLLLFQWVSHADTSLTSPSPAACCSSSSG